MTNNHEDVETDNVHNDPSKNELAKLEPPKKKKNTRKQMTKSQTVSNISSITSTKPAKTKTQTSITLKAKHAQKTHRIGVPPGDQGAPAGIELFNPLRLDPKKTLKQQLS